MYFTPEDFFYVFIRLLSQVFIRDAPGISEKDENRSKSTKVKGDIRCGCHGLLDQAPSRNQ